MVKILAVYNADPAFGERLVSYVNQKEKISFIAMASSSLDRLIEYGEDHSIEILLVDESSRALVEDVRTKQVMVLCDRAPVDGPDIFPAIRKHQPGDCIVYGVLASYCSRSVEPALVLLGSEALIVGIYSPVNRCSKSSLTLTIGQVMAKEESVLYLSLKEHSGLARLIDSEYKADLLDVLCLYRQGEYSWTKLKPMINNWGNMDFIPPMRYTGDLSRVAPEDMAQLINRIARESGHDRLVVDVGQMGRGVLPVLSTCNVVYMPVREDYISTAKIKESEEYPEEADGAGARDGIQKLRLLGHTSITRQEGCLEQLIWGGMGDLVRQLLNGKRPER